MRVPAAGVAPAAVGTGELPVGTHVSVRHLVPAELPRVHPRVPAELRVVAVNLRRGGGCELVLVSGAVGSGAAAVDDVGDRPCGRLDAVGVTCDGDGARRGGLVDLDPRAGLRLEALDRLPAPSDDSADHLFGALHEVLRLPGADGAASHGSALEEILHQLGGDVDAPGGPGDGDLSGHALGEVLVDGDVSAGLRLESFDGLATLTDDAPD